jgi:hypothetical protein
MIKFSPENLVEHKHRPRGCQGKILAFLDLRGHDFYIDNGSMGAPRDLDPNSAFRTVTIAR